MSEDRESALYKEALQFHAQGRPGKIEVVPTKPVATQRDLSEPAPGHPPCTSLKLTVDAAEGSSSAIW